MLFGNLNFGDANRPLLRAIRRPVYNETAHNEFHSFLVPRPFSRGFSSVY